MQFPPKPTTPQPGLPLDLKLGGVLLVVFLAAAATVAYFKPWASPTGSAASAPGPRSTGPAASANKPLRAAWSPLRLPATPTAPDSVAQIQKLVAHAPAPISATAARLLDFAGTGEQQMLRNLDRVQVKALADYIATQVPPEEIATLVERYLGIPAAMTRDKGNLADHLMGIYDAAAGEGSPERRQPTVIFTDECNPDGSIAGSLHTIPAGSKRVYAIFENTGPLEGLDQVLAVWRNPADDRMVSMRSERLRAGSRYNYVWLDPGGGWPSGAYELELRNPANNSQLLFRQSFSVQ